MKTKQIGYLGLIVLSGLMLSACTKQAATENKQSSDNTQTQEEQLNPSETADKKRPGQQIDLATAAEKLGVTEEALKAALGITDKTKEVSTTPGAEPSGEPKQMDFAAAAKTLGVTEDELKEALGMDNMPSGEPQNRNGLQESTSVNQE